MSKRDCCAAASRRCSSGEIRIARSASTPMRCIASARSCVLLLRRKDSHADEGPAVPSPLPRTMTCVPFGAALAPEPSAAQRNANRRDILVFSRTAIASSVRSARALARASTPASAPAPADWLSRRNSAPSRVNRARPSLSGRALGAGGGAGSSAVATPCPSVTAALARAAPWRRPLGRAAPVPWQPASARAGRGRLRAACAGTQRRSAARPHPPCAARRRRPATAPPGS